MSDKTDLIGFAALWHKETVTAQTPQGEEIFEVYHGFTGMRDPEPDSRKKLPVQTPDGVSVDPYIGITVFEHPARGVFVMPYLTQQMDWAYPEPSEMLQIPLSKVKESQTRKGQIMFTCEVTQDATIQIPGQWGPKNFHLPKGTEFVIFGYAKDDPARGNRPHLSFTIKQEAGEQVAQVPQSGGMPGMAQAPHGVPTSQALPAQEPEAVMPGQPQLPPEARSNPDDPQEIPF